MKEGSKFKVEASVSINATPAQVWDALTNPGKIRQYLFGSETITDWKRGSEIIFTGEYYGRKFRDQGRILEIENEKILKFTYWNSGEGYENIPSNYSIITYILTETSKDIILLQYCRENIPTEFERGNSEKFIGPMLSQLKAICEQVEDVVQ